MKKPIENTETKFWENMQKLNPTLKKKQLLTEAEEEKWIQKAGMKKGALHDRLGIPEDDTIPMSVINRHIKILEKKSAGDKKLTPDDAKFMKQLVAAKNMKRLNEDFDSGINMDEIVQEDTYFETLASALDAVKAKAAAKGYTVDEDALWNEFGTGGIGYLQTKRANLPLLKDGMPQKNRSISVVIYRMDSGKYELVSYIN